MRGTHLHLIFIHKESVGFIFVFIVFLIFLKPWSGPCGLD